MSQILITADIHFGVPGKLDDILYACRVMQEYCSQAGIDTILVLGDLFHDRRYLEIDVLSASYKFFEKAKDELNQNWIVFPGNHDMFLKHSWEINSLTPLKEKMTVIETVTALQIENQKFWILPFVHNEKAYMQLLKKINDQASEDDMLLTHIGTHGAIMNTCFMLKDWGMVSFTGTKFKRVYTGHFHSRQSIMHPEKGEHVFYPGGPIPFKQDEGNVAHGFYVLDLLTSEHKFINIWKAGKKFFPDEKPPAQYCSILDADINNLSIDDIKHNNIRIALSEDTSEEKKREIRQKLTEMGANNVSWMNLKTSEPDLNEISESLNKLDLFEIYLANDAKGTKDLNIDLLKRLNADIIKEGDEQYSYSAED